MKTQQLVSNLLKILFSVGVALTTSTAPAFASTSEVALTQLIEQALENDASRQQFFAQSQAIRETGIASSTLMDPKLKLGVAGLPVDSFEFDSDPMTNISIGLMQEFGRGNTLALQQKKSGQQADGMILQVAQRELEVANSITQLWLELGFLQQAHQVLLQNQALMREMAQYIESNYAIGRSEAQDLLNAQLQVSQLDEKIQANTQMQQRIVSQLSEWLGSHWLNRQRSLIATSSLKWQKLNALLAQNSNEHNQSDYYAQLLSHPMVKMADAQINVNQTQVAIAEQAYSPQFGVEVMYAYRQANGMNGAPASDLVSAYLTMDIPLFTENRQDRNHAAAQYQVVAAKSSKDLLLAQMNAKVNALIMDKHNLEQRLERYQSTLIKQAQQRTKAVERGYENNTAQFNDVIAATRDELALEMEQWRLIADLNITNSNLAYLLQGFDHILVQPVRNEP